MRDEDAILTIILEGFKGARGTLVGIEEDALLHKPIFTVYGIGDIPSHCMVVQSAGQGLLSI